MSACANREGSDDSDLLRNMIKDFASRMHYPPIYGKGSEQMHRFFLVLVFGIRWLQRLLIEISEIL